jgi:hypothetical protein
MEKESMVIYKSIISAIDLLPNVEQKWEAIKGITDFGFYDKEPESENPIINMIYIQAIPSLRSAKDRYDIAVENGKKGGRPAEVSMEKIIQMKNEGMTNKQIADAMGCTVKNIENRITSYKKNNPNNPNNPPRTTPITPTKNDDIYPNNPNNPPITKKVLGDPNNPNNLSVSVSEYVSEYEYVSGSESGYPLWGTDEASLLGPASPARSDPSSPSNPNKILAEAKIIELHKRMKWDKIGEVIKDEFGLIYKPGDIAKIVKDKSEDEQNQILTQADNLKSQQKQDKALQRKLTYLDDLMSALDNRGVMATDDEVIAKCKEFYYSNRPDKYKWSCKDLIEIVNNSHSKINDTFDSVLKEFVEIKNNYV